MEAVLCSSFDWNGIRQPYMLATENDSLNGVSMMFGHLLTGAAQVFSDVRTYWSPEAVKRVTGFDLTGDASNGFIHLINSGASALDGSGQQSIEGQPAMKPWYNISENEVQKCLDNTTWGAGKVEYFRGGGFSSTFNTKGGMPVTMSRINIIKGQGPVLQIAEGQTIDLPENVHKTLTERTDPRLTGEGNFKDVYSVMANWGANHGAFTYGHIGAQLMALASMLRIPVCMHNVPEEQIFRPSSWSGFGMDKEGSDYRACEVYGPLYR
jgi:L-fucose isomerase